PRYDYDVCFFRAYEDGKPAKVEHYFKWSKAGPKEGDLAFVAGHPGKTDRMDTVAELEYLRDKGLPSTLERLYRREVALGLESGGKGGNGRKGKDVLFSAQNSRKAFDGMLAGLLDPKLMARKQEAEKKLRAAVHQDPELKDVAKVWKDVAAVQKVRAKLIREYTLLEAGHAFWALPFNYARSLLRAAEEKTKPNEKRLQGYTETDLPALGRQLLAQRPIYDDMETLKLADSLTWLAEALGAGHPLVKKVLAGKSPRDRAAELVQGSKLKDVSARKALWE